MTGPQAATPASAQQMAARRAGLRQASLAVLIMLIVQFALGIGVNLYVTLPPAGTLPGLTGVLNHRSRAVLGAQDGGQVLGRDPVQVQMDLGRPFERGARLGEWWCGPRHSVERGHGSRMRDRGAGRVCGPAVPPPGEQAHHASGADADSNPGGYVDHLEKL